MTGTYDPLTGLLLQPYGGNPDAWGVVINNNLTLIGQALKGVSTISSAGGSYTLSNTDYAVNQTRQQVLRNVGTQTSDLTLIIPPHESWYWAVNDGTSGGYTCSIGVSGGLMVSLPYGRVTPVYSDGVNTFSMLPALNLMPVPTAFIDMDGFTVSNLPTPTLATHAATKAYADSLAAATMDTIAPPTVAFSFNGQRLVNLGSPINPNDAVNLQAMTGAIAAASLSGVSTLTAAANTFLAGPAAGAATGTPAFRAITNADLPDGGATTLQNQIFSP